MKKDNLVNLAKSAEKKPKAPIVKKEKKEDKTPEKVLTPEEERNLKTKAKVDELLDGVVLTPKTEGEKEELLEVDDDEPKSTEWLEEQCTKLSEENERIKSELLLANEDYKKIFVQYQQLKNGGIQETVTTNDDALQIKVVQLFNELQAQYLSMGTNPMTGQPNFIIFPIGFMNRLIMFFPFLEQHKRF